MFDLLLEIRISVNKVPHFVPECHMIHHCSNGLFSYCLNCNRVIWEAEDSDPRGGSSDSPVTAPRTTGIEDGDGVERGDA